MKSLCPSCSAPIDVHVGQRIQENRISWFEGFRCSRCGRQQESDGKDETPEDIRRAILENEGEWSLVLGIASGSQSTSVLKVLRNVLHLSLAEASEMKKLLPGAILKGTHTEMERLARVFNEAGAIASVAQNQLLHKESNQP